MQTKTIFTYIQTLSFMRTANEYKATLYGTMYNRLKLFREKKKMMNATKRIFSYINFRIYYLKH